MGRLEELQREMERTHTNRLCCEATLALAVRDENKAREAYELEKSKTSFVFKYGSRFTRSDHEGGEYILVSGTEGWTLYNLETGRQRTHYRAGVGLGGVTRNMLVEAVGEGWECTYRRE